ncbi:hypothetical protein RRF57_003468 [Xylaria bambusicola]|uniref:Uncharacterized protein n=1 Tax=Xylaria bambusicola TaxID=326684 RepID=A0AAN7UHJ5_9PEZI
MSSRTAITAAVEISPPNRTAQPISNNLTALNIASESSEKADKPNGVCVGRDATGVVFAARSVTTKSVKVSK